MVNGRLELVLILEARQLPQLYLIFGKSRGKNVICPWFSCPECDCELVWDSRCYSRNVEKLSCSSESCNFETDRDEIVLTRQSMQEPSDKKPDILFTTSETLNKRMGDLWSRRIFGIGYQFRQRPRFLIGRSSYLRRYNRAQNALTLRRWRHAIGETPKFSWVGLSATLKMLLSSLAVLQTLISPEFIMKNQV